MAKLIFGHLMAKIYKPIFIKHTRLYAKYSLVFLLLVLFVACKKHSKAIVLVWKGQHAIGIQIPQSLIRDVSALRIKHSVKVIIAGSKAAQGILGNFTLTDDIVLFEPLIPLSPGLSYDILQDDKLIGQIKIPVNAHEEAPKLVSIYPDQDTLPENLLKIYLHFSKPMRTGHSLDNIYILDGHKDTMRKVFLDLQPELWDTTRTVLTLWLDPGRIKRGLVLNKELGNPLKKAETYQLVILSKWKDNAGLSLVKEYTKQFTAGARDEQSPDIRKWKLSAPKAGTSEALIINTLEPLDHYLLQESIGIFDGHKMIYSTSKISEHGKVLTIVPIAPWEPHAYKIRVLARLEDLVGNNLNHVFDRDITKDKQQRNQGYYERSFEVKP